MLFGSTLLEVGIGVVFVYLLLSMLCSALSELIESFLKFRARDLEKGIGKLLNDPDLAKDLLNHPLIKPLGEKPSYIPARTFSLALWNLATTGAAKGEAVADGVTQDMKVVKGLILSLDDNKYKEIKTALLTLIDEAGNDIGKARTNIETWYNDAMDRVSGWYKRRTHWILIVLGLLAAAFLNVDTINVVSALWYNDALRSSVSTAAEDYLKDHPKTVASAQTSPPTAAEAAAAAEEQAKIAQQKIDNIRGEINKLGLPIGWVFQPNEKDPKYRTAKKEIGQELYKEDEQAYRVDLRRFPDDGNGWFLKVLGIFITALAVSQGAPFWFDVLNKFIVVRSTVKPHEKSPEQPSKDKPKKTEGDDPEGGK